MNEKELDQKLKKFIVEMACTVWLNRKARAGAEGNKALEEEYQKKLDNCFKDAKKELKELLDIKTRQNPSTDLFK